MRAKLPNRGIVDIKDATYNTHERSGASVDYGRGVLIGLVSGLMATGLTFDDAWTVVKACLPEGYRADCIPDSWQAKARR